MTRLPCRDVALAKNGTVGFDFDGIVPNIHQLNKQHSTTNQHSLQSGDSPPDGDQGANHPAPWTPKCPEALPCCAGYPAPKRLTSAVRKLGLRLKQFALRIAVNPFGSGCGTRGRGVGRGTRGAGREKQPYVAMILKVWFSFLLQESTAGRPP